MQAAAFGVRGMIRIGQQLIPTGVKTKGASLVKGINTAFEIAKNAVCRSAQSRTAKIAGTVLNNVAPHLIPVFTWQLAHLKNFNIITILGSNLYVGYNSYVICKTDKINKRVLLNAVVGAVNSLDNTGMMPTSKYVRVAVDSLMLVATALGCFDALVDGTRYLIVSFSDRGSSDQKVAQLASGLIIIGLGCTAGHSVYQNSRQLWQGLTAFNRLDPEQQVAALKFRSIHELNGVKTCKALVIDGSRPTSRHSAPAIETIYTECSTLTYRVRSAKQLCQALQKANAHFGKPIDLLVLFGPSNSTGQFLDDKYFFKAAPSDPALACMTQYLKTDAQLVLIGANTAKQVGNTPAYATQLSNHLPNKEVIGFVGNYIHFFTTQAFTNGKFYIHSYTWHGSYLTRVAIQAPGLTPL